MIEIWKTIRKYPDYQASNFGRIKSLKFGFKNKEISRIYNVSPETISSIKNKRSWKHITENL